MSTQACSIRIFGYKFDYKDLLFSHINDNGQEYDFVDIIGMDIGYYELRDMGSSDKGLLKIIIDGMCGEYKYVGFITEASYILNTHGDDYWRNTFRNDNFIKEYAKSKIQTLLGRELGEPQEYVFEHYS